MLLPRSFYARPTLTVARELLGQILVRNLGGQRVSGIIVETEAYCGVNDAGCHASKGQTPRTAVIFGPPGYAYVYFVYGMHYCFNIVCEDDGVAGAVLVRALRPLEGIEQLRARRGNRKDGELTNGPAKLCAALDIARPLNRADLCIGQNIWLEAIDRLPDVTVRVGPRIGLNSVPEPARSVPWRFVVAGEPDVSRPWPQMPYNPEG